MAISAMMLFKSNDDVRKLYDAIIDEMGVRDNPPAGLIHHWCAAVYEGLRVCDVWETRESFDAFAKSKIMPLSAKHGLPPPALEITPVHEFIIGGTPVRKGTGYFVDFDGNTVSLLKNIDEVNRRIDAESRPPAGLAFHCTTPSSAGVRVIDHWRSGEDFERFIDTTLGSAFKAVGIPQPKITDFEVHNTLGKRVPAHA